MMNNINLHGDIQFHLSKKIFNKATNNHNYNNLNEDQKIEIGKKVVKAFKFLGFYDQNNKLSKEKTIIENLVDILNLNLALKPGETDLVVMQHIFKIQNKDNKITIKKSTMVVIGEKHGKTAMSITVGTPTAIAT